MAHNGPTSEEVLAFWLGERPDDPATVENKRRIWFAGGAALDAEIRERFEPTLAQFVAGELDDWRATPRGRLASIVVLDQFSRNIYRGTARAFAQDPLAQRFLREGLELGAADHLGVVERTFFFLPFHHAEDLALQRESVRLMTELAAVSPDHLRGLVTGFRDYAREHCGVIERFGRFPHRNEVLGRESSEDEIAYLAGGGNRYGQ